MGNKFNKYHEHLDSIRLTEKQKEAILGEILSKADSRNYSNSKRVGLNYRVVLSIAVVCVMLAIPAFALISSFAQLQWLLPSGDSEILQELGRVCEYDGIRLEVVAATSDGSTAIVYLCLQDLRANRIDGGLSLETIQITSGEQILTSRNELLLFDADSGVAYIKSTIIDIDTTTLTISLDAILSDRTDTVTRLANVGDLPLTERYVELSDSAGLSDVGNITGWVLYPLDAPSHAAHSQKVNITAAGYIEDRLRIQYRWSLNSPPEAGEELFLRAVSASNGKAGTLDQITFDFDTSTGRAAFGNEYRELVFNIPPSDLHLYDLYLSAYDYRLRVEGKWALDIPLNRVNNHELTISGTDLEEVSNMRISSMSVKPLGVYLDMDYELFWKLMEQDSGFDLFNDLRIILEMQDGKMFISSYGINNTVNMIYPALIHPVEDLDSNPNFHDKTSGPIVVDEVARIYLNDQLIYEK